MKYVASVKTKDILILVFDFWQLKTYEVGMHAIEMSE
jgi:hypothetical protein